MLNGNKGFFSKREKVRHSIGKSGYLVQTNFIWSTVDSVDDQMMNDP